MDDEGSVYQRMITLAVQNVVPLVVMCNLTYRCPLRCRHCYVDEPPRPTEELTREEYEGLFADLAAARTLFLTFSGGEPTVRPDFLDLVKSSRSYGFAVRVFSGGWEVSDAEAAALARLKLLGVEFSLHSLDAAAHDAFVGRRGAWRTVAEAVRRLTAAGVPVMIKMCVMEWNAGDVKPLYELAASWGAEFRHSPFLFPGNSGSTRPLSYRMSDEQLLAYYRWMLEGDPSPAETTCYDPSAARAPRNLTTLTCMAAFNNCALDPYGNVRPCLSLNVNAGNIRSQRFQDIWRGEEMQKVRALASRPMPACDGCVWDEHCFRCLAASLLEEGDMDIPPREYCRHARIKKEALRRPSLSSPSRL